MRGPGCRGDCLPSPPHRFYINLLCNDEKDSDISLHFNPRLDESTVVLNNMERGSWGKEERGKGLPFQRGQPFEVLIIATQEGFKVCPSPLLHALSGRAAKAYPAAHKTLLKSAASESQRVVLPPPGLVPGSWDVWQGAQRAWGLHPEPSPRRRGPQAGGVGAWPGRRGPEGAPAANTRPRPLPLQAVVGDSEYIHFRHRMPMERVRLIEVGGDLMLDSVKVF